MSSGTKRVADEPMRIDDGKGDFLEIMPLGSGQEVGRSCVVVRYKNRCVMFDCGVHPGYTGESSLPLFDMIDFAEIDLVLVTHFHLDHCGAVPWLLKKRDFRGRCFMTHPTKAIYKMVVSDSVRVTNQSSVEVLFTAEDLERSMESIELIDYHQQLEHKGIKFWCYNAGHVLGAAMFMIDIAGVRVLYTGDFSRYPDRHLMGAETPTVAPDVVIVESTYGTQTHEKREEREARFCSLVSNIVLRGGRCLLPVFALGRAQELLLILEEHWAKNPTLQQFPVYYASSLSRRCMQVYRTYINMMNEHIRDQFEVRNPFEFRHVSNLKSMQHFDDAGPCVVMASPGMLQNGMSRQLFDRWVENPKNGIILPGYSADGTLAKILLNDPREVQLSDGRTVIRGMSIDSISFSAHSDYDQTVDFLTSTRPQHIVLVHGDVHRMTKLKSELDDLFRRRSEESKTTYTPTIAMPANCESVHLTFGGEKRARVIGLVKQPEIGAVLKGILLARDFSHFLIAATDLSTVSTLSAFEFRSTLRCPFASKNWPSFLATLRTFFSAVRPDEGNEFKCHILDAAGQPVLGISMFPDQEPQMKTFSSLAKSPADDAAAIDSVLQVAWGGNEVSDTLADIVLALAIQSPHKDLQTGKDVERLDAELEIVRRCHSLLSEYFGTFVTVDLTERTFSVQLDDEAQTKATITYKRGMQGIECSNADFKHRVDIAWRRIVGAVMALPDDCCAD